jgi:enoyl-CoA hydratase/carnithine racemase
MSSDFRLGTPDAKTSFLFTRVGLAGCDMGACAILPRIIGQERASELLFTGRSMSAEEAAAWGFFNRLVSPDEVLKESLQLAGEIASGPAFAHAMMKKMLHAEWNLSVDAAIDAEAQAICMQTEDFRRAYRAFAAKQKPQFQGN